MKTSVQCEERLAVKDVKKFNISLLTKWKWRLR